MNRSYYSASLQDFLADDEREILGHLAANHRFALEGTQKDAWVEQIRILKEQLNDLGSGHIMFEYSIPRMGKRVDVVLIYSGIVFVIEFKVREDKYPQNAQDQCYDYALDLKNFQGGSRDARLVPLLICTDAPEYKNTVSVADDNVFDIIFANTKSFKKIITDIAKEYGQKEIDAKLWEESTYRPTPTIIEAAQALYSGHNVEEVSRSDAGAENLELTAKAIDRIVEKSKNENRKSICFVTGVPGAGKTLAGLNIATRRRKADKVMAGSNISTQRKKTGSDERAVFLSGNGPLVEVLQEALARDRKKQYPKERKGAARQATKAFIQNIHHFRDYYLKDKSTPNERIVIFDEAQRAWDEKKTSNFMKRKKGIPNFNRSESDFLISVLDRHSDWAVIVCLVGGGQEINSGEAGIFEWFDAIRKDFRDWDVYVSDKINSEEYTQGRSTEELFSKINKIVVQKLHLAISIRAFRSPNVSQFVKLLLDCDATNASHLLEQFGKKYPIMMTRSLFAAKQWLRKKARSTERYGITASAKAHRLRPYGIYAGYDVNAPRWFLNSKDDLRSSYYLESVATEFDIQGLELDWTCVAWDGNFRHDGKEWIYREFRGTKWTNINKEKNQTYLKNAYRVLLTRARQGMIVFVPHGDDKDPTRKPEYYDSTYEYLKNIGICEIN